MKLSATIEGLAGLARFDAERLITRLRADLERELQLAAATSELPLDQTAQRAALDRALMRVAGRAP
jgi:hypothetical protein